MHYLSHYPRVCSLPIKSLLGSQHIAVEPNSLSAKSNNVRPSKVTPRFLEQEDRIGRYVQVVKRNIKILRFEMAVTLKFLPPMNS